MPSTVERVEHAGDTVTVTYRDGRTGRTRRALFTIVGTALRAVTPWHDHPLARRAAVEYLAAHGVEAW